MIRDGRDTPAYWQTRAEPYLGGDEEWRAVSVEGPAVIARLHMRFEERGVRVLERHLPRKGRVLDAGCGVGRWFRLIAPGRSLTGVDFSEPLVERAATNEHGVEVLQGDVRDLPLADASFEATYTVKVLQCLRDEERPKAVAELFRVTAPGGVVILFEKTRGADGSAPSQWLRWGESSSGRLVEWHPNGYMLLDRAIARAAVLVARSGGEERSPPEGRGDVDRSSRADLHPRLYAAYMRIRALTLGVSFPMEPLAERLLPPTWSDHGIFVFTK